MTIQKTADLIRQSERICILTGAGISSESGIPTFRDKQTGLWENHRAEDLANINAFHRDPKFVWGWYQWRRGQVADKRPNPAHHALADLEKWALKNSKTFTLITQNVDDLHEQAGSTATHLHGHLWRNKCSECGQAYEGELDYADDALLTCPNCGGWVRPDIVWFGENLPKDAWVLAEQASSQCDVFMSIGTSSLVYPAAGLSQLAKQCGATIVEVNPNPTQSPHIDVMIEEKAGVALPEIINAL